MELPVSEGNIVNRSLVGRGNNQAWQNYDKLISSKSKKKYDMERNMTYVVSL